MQGQTNEALSPVSPAARCGGGGALRGADNTCGKVCKWAPRKAAMSSLRFQNLFFINIAKGFKNIYSIIMCKICAYICACECRYLRRPEESVRFPSARVTGSCEPPSVGARGPNSSPLLRASSKCS